MEEFPCKARQVQCRCSPSWQTRLFTTKTIFLYLLNGVVYPCKLGLTPWIFGRFDRPAWINKCIHLLVLRFPCPPPVKRFSPFQQINVIPYKLWWCSVCCFIGLAPQGTFLYIKLFTSQTPNKKATQDRDASWRTFLKTLQKFFFFSLKETRAPPCRRARTTAETIPSKNWGEIGRTVSTAPRQLIDRQLIDYFLSTDNWLTDNWSTWLG
jgi:hypothetical protein